MRDRRQLELDLRAGLASGELEVHFQPILDLERDEIVCCEALLRWNHPKRGLVSPSEFIPIAEETGLIIEIGDWVLRRACVEAARWPRPIKVSVNLSPRQFLSGRLLLSIVSALEAAKLPPKRLELEITELVMLANNVTTLATLHELRKLGVAIAMDDFGTGYSSLSYLRQFPFDKIKIDQSFIRDLGCNSESVSIVRAILSLGAALSIATTAEGVETSEQLQILREEGCSSVQGYLISRPVPAADVSRLLGPRARTTTAA